MIYYRQDRITKQLYRRAGNGSEEYIFTEQRWVHTADAVEAFYDSSDTKQISETEALTIIEKHIKK